MNWQMVINFIWEYRYIGIAIVAFGIYFTVERQSALKVISTLMLSAEKLARDAILQAGTEQRNWVREKAKLILPKYVLIFLTDDRLDAIIEYLFEKAKDYADNGVVDGSVK